MSLHHSPTTLLMSSNAFSLTRIGLLSLIVALFLAFGRGTSPASVMWSEVESSSGATLAIDTGLDHTKMSVLPLEYVGTPELETRAIPCLSIYSMIMWSPLFERSVWGCHSRCTELKSSPITIGPFEFQDSIGGKTTPGARYTEKNVIFTITTAAKSGFVPHENIWWLGISLEVYTADLDRDLSAPLVSGSFQYNLYIWRYTIVIFDSGLAFRPSSCASISYIM